jgi:hypothetical protein
MTVSVAACTAIVCAVLAGCSASSGPPQTAASEGSLTAKQKRTALRLAQGEVRRLARSVTNISATIGPGNLPLEQSNSGHACASGTVTHIRIIGTFNAAVAPPPSAPGAPPEDSTITAEEIVADAKTGDICLIQVRVGPVAPEPGATILLQK